uniref:Uncharacterized protein n=1 Tax=viral metagenome TaxID=1070528 RepID=A0A6C0KPR1_9ZZZZ
MIKNNYPRTMPTFQQELDFFQIPRSQTFINAFGQTPQHSKGQNISIDNNISVKKSSLPGQAMQNIFESAGLPYPPKKIGGKKKSKKLKKNKKKLTKLTKLTKRVKKL